MESFMFGISIAFCIFGFIVGLGIIGLVGVVIFYAADRLLSKRNG